MKLTPRMGFGFGVLVLAILVLGVLGVVNMKRVAGLSLVMERDTVPEIVLASGIERGALALQPVLRDYGYTGDPASLDQVRTRLGQIKKNLAEARAHGGSSPHLAKLKAAAEQGEKTIIEFQSLTEERAKLTGELEFEGAGAYAAGSNFLTICSLFLDRQTDALLGKIAAEIEGDQLESNLRRINHLSGIIRSGKELVGSTWKAQARRDPRILAECFAILDGINVQMTSLEKIIDFENDRNQIAACRVSCQTYRESLQRYQLKWGQREEVAQRQSMLAENLTRDAESVASLGLDDTRNASRKTASIAAYSSIVSIVCAIVGLALGIVVAWLITLGLVRLLRNLAGALHAESDQLSSAAGQVSAASQSLAEGASEQASTLEETSASLEELASMTRRNAENSGKASDLARQTRESAQQGVEDMSAMAQAMTNIKRSSDDISKIIKTIDEIAFQTNILALNAAVEAARAGEAGMGFAVVADEVRALAQRSAAAARETNAMIESAIQNTSAGVKLSQKVSGTLDLIVSEAKEMSDLVDEVASATREQSQGLNQINTAVSQMDKVTQSNAANAEESAAAAEQLNAQSEALKDSVAELTNFISAAQEKNLPQTALAASRSSPPRQSLQAPENSRGAASRNSVSERISF